MKRFYLVFLVMLPLGLPACGTMANGRGWGQDTVLMPGWDRLGTAAVNAAASPATWGPAVGAILFQAGNADRNLSEWASRSAPVYGSPRNAEQRSDDFLVASAALWAFSAALVPSGEDSAEWSLNKVRGFVVQGGSAVVMNGTVNFLKEATDRARPNNRNRESFPSGHAAGTAFFTSLTERNLAASGLSSEAMLFSRIGLGALTAATSWARVEASEHHPSDVLAGIALGRFLGVFLTDAFMGLDNPRSAIVLLEPSREGGVQARISFSF